LDNTPEKSLIAKYRDLLTYVFKNPDMRLLATDRMISVTNENGEVSYLYQVFGNNIVTGGTYAIYELN